jgi:RNA polymerase sigma-70 factor (ECF subfamily)
VRRDELGFDSGGFGAFYDRYAEGLLLFFVRRTCDVETAMDLTAETFAQAFAHRRSFRGESPGQAAGWLYGTARHQLSQFFRRGRIERRALDRLGAHVPEISEDQYARIEQLAGLDSLRAAVAAALGSLPGDQREALRLRIVEELPYPLVAERLTVSEQTARMRVSRGLRALAEAIEPSLLPSDQAT